MSNLFELTFFLDFPSQGMLGTTGGRFLGPSGSQPHRNLWPLHSGRGLDFQTNGEGMLCYGYNNVVRVFCVLFSVS